MWLSRWWLPLGAGMLFFGIVLGNGPLIGLSVFLLIAGWLARVWADHVLDNVRYERIIPESRAFPDEVLTVTLRLVNDKPLPVPLIEVKDSVPEGVPIEEEHVSQAPYPGYLYLTRSTHLTWYERISWPLDIRALDRGFYRLGPVHLNSSDIFGFYPMERDETRFDTIVIYPRIYSLPELGLPAQRPFGERKGYDRIFEDPSRIAGLRDYRPGDPLRRIDWKASARSQVLQSRVYEPSSTLHMLVALNVHTLAHSWEGYVPQLLERLVSAAGSVARYGFEAGYAIGLVANSSFPESDRPMRIPVGRRSDQLGRVLEALAGVGPLTLSPLETVLEREAQAFPFGATLVCVTARMDPPLAAALHRIAMTGHNVSILSLADEPFEEIRGVRVFEIATAMKALEARSREPIPANGARA